METIRCEDVGYQQLIELALKRDPGYLWTPDQLCPDRPVVNLGGPDMQIRELNDVIKPIIGLEYPEWDWRGEARLPFKDDDVRMIHCYHFLEHFNFKNFCGIMREVERVLMPGGIFQYGVPYYASRLAHDPAHEIFFSEKTFEYLLRNYKYYPSHLERDWKLVVSAQAIVGVEGHNLMLVGQITKQMTGE